MKSTCQHLDIFRELMDNRVELYRAATHGDSNAQRACYGIGK